MVEAEQPGFAKLSEETEPEDELSVWVEEGMGASGITSIQRNGSTITLERVIPEPRGQWMAVPRQVNRVAQPVVEEKWWCGEEAAITRSIGSRESKAMLGSPPA
ncbi:MAG: hypothetical protein OXF02_05165 [Simkaniaceae bacterium]|nr:hypothetical protein [Simkaniaceae bacterium]